ncbi:MAG TPA: hypothetical protein VGL22_17855 [Terracidiphilus sp.]|jgi:hypothetical protein
MTFYAARPQKPVYAQEEAYGYSDIRHVHVGLVAQEFRPSTFELIVAAKAGAR